jgi:hypothetical protein
MKKIVCYISIVSAIFFLNSVCALDVKTELGFNTAQQRYAFENYQLDSENVIFAECLEDISDEDSEDSERKKASARNRLTTNIFFAAQYFSTNTLIQSLPQKLFFPLRTSLFAFICVWRI